MSPRGGRALILLFLLVAPALGAARKAPVDIDADVLDYDSKARVLYAEGHVVAVSSGTTMKADVLTYDLRTKILRSSGPAEITEGTRVTRGINLVYDLSVERGKLSQAVVDAPPWRAWGRTMERRGPNEFVMLDGVATSCDLDPPHYRIESKRLRVRPEESLYLTRGVMKVGNVPAFFMPWYYASLRPRKYNLEIHPSYNEGLGVYARGMLGYQ